MLIVFHRIKGVIMVEAEIENLEEKSEDFGTIFSEQSVFRDLRISQIRFNTTSICSQK